MQVFRRTVLQLLHPLCVSSMLTFMADLDISSIASEARNRRLSQQKGGKNEFSTQQRGVKK